MDKTMKELKAEVTDMGLDHSMNIYQRMLKAQSMVETVSKNLQVDAGKQRYKAVSERDILDAVKKSKINAAYIHTLLSERCMKAKRRQTKMDMKHNGCVYRLYIDSSI